MVTFGNKPLGKDTRLDVSLVNLLDEFSQPSFPFFSRSTDLSSVRTVLEELDQHIGRIDNFRLKRFGQILWNILIPREIRQYLERLEEKHAVQLLMMTNNRQVPWEIIHDNTGFWALKYTMGRIYSSDADIIRLPKRGKKSPENRPPLLLIYNPEENLIGAQREGERLEKMLKDTFSVRALGGKHNVFDLQENICSNQFDIIHFAGHAQEGKEGGLLAANGELTSQQIAQYSLDRNPVIFANACATGATGGYYGEYSLSLADAFIRAGASAFIGTLWKTDDDISTKFASCVYTHLKAGRMIGDALLRARNTLAKNPGSDIDWAAFALFGNPDSRLYASIPREDVVPKKVQITMSNRRGTLARILLALSESNVNIIQGRSITFDDEKTAGYIAEIEVPSELSADDLRSQVRRKVRSLVYDLDYIN